MLDDAATVRSYKSLSQVERAFRCIKTVDLHVRPIYHWLADRVRAHVFLCMLAYYLEWQMRQKLAPMLYKTTPTSRLPRPRDRAWWRRRNARRRRSASRPRGSHQTSSGCTASAHCWPDLATLTRNTVVTAIAPALPLTVLARPTPVQRRAYELLELAV